MKLNTLSLLALGLLVIFNSSFSCQKDYVPSCPAGYTSIDLAIPVIPASTRTTFTIGDTLKFNSVVSDILKSANQTEYTFKLDPFSMIAEIYKIVTPAGSTIPALEPVIADFNQVVFDGQIDANVYGRNLKFNYRRLQSNNYLSAGLECNKRGKYLIRFTSQQAYQTGSLYNYSLYPCSNFNIKNAYSGPQNNAIFTQYNVSTINILPSYTGYSGVLKDDKNYVIIDVN